MFGFTSQECLSVKICCISPSDSESNRDGADAESPFLLFFSFFASFKNSNRRGKVGKLSSFWDWWAESLFIFIIVAKYIIFPHANNCCSPDKKNFWRSDMLTLSACTIGILSALTYTEFDCAALLATLEFQLWRVQVFFFNKSRARNTPGLKIRRKIARTLE